MNLLNALAAPNQTILLVVGGLALLLVNIIYSVIRVWRGNLKAGWFTVGLVLVACALITVGAVQTASASAALSNRPNRGAFSGGSITPTVVANASPTAEPTTASSDPAILVSDAKPTAVPDNTQSDSAQSATPRKRTRATQTADGTGDSSAVGTPDANSTQSATPTKRTRPTQAAGGGSGDSGSAGTTNGQSAGTTDQNGGSPSANLPAGTGTNGPNAARFAAIQQDQAGLTLAALGGGLCILLALALYFFERRRTGFTVANSRGLLNLAAGFFVVIAALLIPTIPGQASSAAAAGPRVNRIAAAVSATPSPTPRPTSTATPLSTLTPTATNTPMAMPTQIQYTSMYTVDMSKSICSVTANTVLSLRADPSTKQQAIGRVFAGSLLNVTGSSADKQWWHVTYTDSGVSTEGWVSAAFVTLTPTCVNQSIPVVSAQ